VRGVAERRNEPSNGISATRSAGASRSSPEAAPRGAAGAGLDGGDPDRSNIDDAVVPAIPPKAVASDGHPVTPRIHTSLTDVTSGQSVASRGIAVEERMRAATPYAGVVAANNVLARTLQELAQFVLEHTR
jgi:hypothetical protein